MATKLSPHCVKKGIFSNYWEVSYEAFDTLKSGEVSSDSGVLNFNGKDANGREYYSVIRNIPLEKMKIKIKGIKGKSYVIEISGEDPTPYM